jgi:recombination protein RecA
VDKSGAWYSYNGERLGQGKENARRFLQENRDIAAEIEERLRGADGLVTEKMAEVIESHSAALAPEAALAASKAAEAAEAAEAG